jgi:hypothetical protein
LGRPLDDLGESWRRRSSSSTFTVESIHPKQIASSTISA